MTLTKHQTTKPCITALSDLVDTARARARAARNQQRNRRADTLDNIALALTLDNIALTLDRVRTRLVEDGPEYLDAAWAFVDGGRKQLAIFGNPTDHDALLTGANHA